MKHRSFNPSGAEDDRVVRVPRANSIDAHVGSRIRFLRTYRRLSQTQLGAALGVTCQQVQKYEGGLNRVSAGRLFDLARVFAVPIDFFFDELPEQIARSTPPSALPHPNDIVDEHHISGGDASLFRRETGALIRAYCRILNPDARNAVLGLIKHLAATQG